MQDRSNPSALAMETLHSCIKPSINIILIPKQLLRKLFTSYAVFVGNISPIDEVAIYLNFKDVLDISNVRIKATDKSSMGHLVTWLLLGPLSCHPLIFLKSL